MGAAVDLYQSAAHPSLQVIADTFSAASNGVSINLIKVRKLLITAGVYESEIADEMQDVFIFISNSGYHTQMLSQQ